jgi:hypothetical protein
MCFCEPVHRICVMEGDVRMFGREQRKWLRASIVWVVRRMRYVNAIMGDDFNRMRKSGPRSYSCRDATSCKPQIVEGLLAQCISSHES